LSAIASASRLFVGASARAIAEALKASGARSLNELLADHERHKQHLDELCAKLEALPRVIKKRRGSDSIPGASASVGARSFWCPTRTRQRRRPLGLWCPAAASTSRGYIPLEHFFAVASHFMPAFSQAACVLGAPAKAGAATATIRLKATIESRVLMGVPPMHLNAQTLHQKSDTMPK